MSDDMDIIKETYLFYNMYKYHISILLVLIIGFGILTYTMMYLYNTGDAQMFNLTEESWSYMKNATIGSHVDILENLNAST